MKHYVAIDLKSFYASVECIERGLDPFTTNLVVADESRTSKTICLAATPAIKTYGVPGRARLFEVEQKIKAANHGIYTMGDIARCSINYEELLYKLFGINAEFLIDHVWGYESCTIEAIKSYKPENNSISSGQVLQEPYSYEKARLIVWEMTDLLVLDLVEKARILSRLKKKTLYLCFNEFLLESLRNAYPNDEYITFHNVRTLGQEILGRDDIPINEIVDVFEKYLDSEYDDNLWAYPNIIVDEAQDLSDTLLEHLSYLMEISGGVFYTFYDRNQAIMKKEPSKWIDEHADCRLVLYRNCRNTSEIAKLICGLVPVREESYINDIHGNTPKSFVYKNGKELQTIAANFVKDMMKNGLKVEDIVILSIHRAEANPLNEISTLAGIPLSKKREPNKVWFTSIRKFKGLEAKAVLIVDFRFSEIDRELSRRIFYVGCSRANAYLQVAMFKDSDEIKDAELLNKLGIRINQ